MNLTLIKETLEAMERKIDPKLVQKYMHKRFRGKDFSKSQWLGHLVLSIIIIDAWRPVRLWCHYCLEDSRTRFRSYHYWPVCLDCWNELHKGIIPMVTRSRGNGRFGWKNLVEEPSPSQENAIRIMEGD